MWEGDKGLTVGEMCGKETGAGNGGDMCEKETRG